MKVPGMDGAHLTYCSNIHPGETWAEVRSNLERYVLPVRERVAAGVPFGLGLRLSGEAAHTLAAPNELAALVEFFRAHDLYAFTINGFPYGAFHGQRVKERVYLPDWLEDERLAYTDTLADILAQLLPPGVEGTISTVPGAFHSRMETADRAERAAVMMARHAAHLWRLGQATGKRLALAIEPEPWCALDTVARTVPFFERHLFGRAGVDELRRHVAVSAGDAESILRSLVGVCFDICHMAVEFEEPADALAAFRAAGVRIAKVQISAGLRARLGGDDDISVRDALRAFADDVYLHQVVERDAAGRLTRYLDLPRALDAAAAGSSSADRSRREWRVHFHVPLFLERLGVFESTQDYVRETLALLRREPPCAHFEVETYTWDVLPAEHRNVDVVTAVARELDWTLAQLAAAAAETGPAARELADA